MLAYLLGAGVIALLIAWQAQDAKVAGIMVGGIGALLVAAALVAWLLIVALKRLPQRGVTWRFGLANLRRRPLASSLQIGALALGLMALLLLTVVRGDLMQNWRASLPPDAPNHFVVNVLPDQVEGVRAALKSVTGFEVVALSDDSRTAGRGQRHAPRHRAVRGHACPPTRRTRIQPVVGRGAVEDEPPRVGQMVRRRHGHAMPASRWSRASPNRSG